MDRLTMRALPARFRERHGDELEDLLSTTSRPIRDHADVVLAGIGMRLERLIRPLLIGAVVCSIGFAAGFVTAVGSLQSGVSEVPGHWWSTAIAAGLAGSMTVTLTLTAVGRRAARWRRTG